MFSNRDLFGLFNNFSLNRMGLGNFLAGLNVRNNRPGSSGQSTNRTSTNNGYQTPSSALQNSTDSTKNTTPTSITRPTDSISPDILTPKTDTEPAIYTKPEVSQDTEDGEETPETTSYERKWVSLVQLSMRFSLSDFESMVSRLAQDAEDGVVDTTVMNDLNIGLSTDLSVDAILQEQTAYENTESLDQTGLSQSTGYTSRQRYAMNMLAQSRQFMASAFYNENSAKAFHQEKTYSDGYLRVTRKMAMRYSQDFSFNYRSLQQYSKQTEALSSTDSMEQYLSATEALVDNEDISSSVIGGFFDMVDSYMDQAEEQLLGKVDEYLSELSSQVGIESEYTDEIKELLVAKVTSFFDKVESAISGVESKYTSTSGQSAELLNMPSDWLV